MRLIDADSVMFTNLEIVMCEGDFKKAFKLLCKKLDDAPTVNVEPQWIPVSEKLPNELERVLITVCYSNDRKDKVIQVGSVYTDRFGDLVWNYTEEYGFCKSKVLAWMPLPEPYKEE